VNSSADRYRKHVVHYVADTVMHGARMYGQEASLSWTQADWCQVDRVSKSTLQPKTLPAAAAGAAATSGRAFHGQPCCRTQRAPHRPQLRPTVVSTPLARPGHLRFASLAVGGAGRRTTPHFTSCSFEVQRTELPPTRACRIYAQNGNTHDSCPILRRLAIPTVCYLTLTVTLTRNPNPTNPY